MRFSRFAPFGALKFSSETPLPRRIYDALWSNLTGAGKADNFARAGYTDAKVYATARALACWLTAARRLDAQIRPETVLELLAACEDAHGLVVPVRATLAERRLALAAQMRLGLGGSYSSLRQALQDLLGDLFVELRQLPEPSRVNVPADPAPGPGNFADPAVPRRLFRLAQNITTFGGSAVYVNLGGGTPSADERLQPGEVVVIEPEHNVLRERVTVVDATFTDGDALLWGNVQKPHHFGALITTQPWPFWVSNRRRWVVRLTPAAALDAEVRRQVDELIGKLVRGVSTWCIVGNDGPFLLGSSPLTATPLLNLSV